MFIAGRPTGAWQCQTFVSDSLFHSTYIKRNKVVTELLAL